MSSPSSDPQPAPRRHVSRHDSRQSRCGPVYLSLNVETDRKQTHRPAIQLPTPHGAGRAIADDRAAAVHCSLGTCSLRFLGPLEDCLCPNLPAAWQHGETLFLAIRRGARNAIRFGGRGGTVGPDLTDIGRKGKEHIYRSIAAPSAEIAPDYLPYTVATRDGRVLAGVVRAEGADAIRVTDTNAKTTTLRREEIDQIRPSGTSIMPVGLAGGLGEAGVRDLIALPDIDKVSPLPVTPADGFA